MSLSTESCRSAALVSITRKPIKQNKNKLTQSTILFKLIHKPHGRKEEAAEAKATFLIHNWILRWETWSSFYFFLLACISPSHSCCQLQSHSCCKSWQSLLASQQLIWPLQGSPHWWWSKPMPRVGDNMTYTAGDLYLRFVKRPDYLWMEYYQCDNNIRWLGTNPLII